MKNYLWLILLLGFMLTSGTALALTSSHEVRDGIEIGFTTPPVPWQVSKEPPDFLIQERAAHLHPPQLEAARKAGIDSPAEAARQMLKADELFLYNPKSGAHLIIDFSPLREGEKPPKARTLKTSARYAGEDLKGEEGVTDVSSRVSKARISGAKAAYRVDADFRSHGEATRFVGIITFALNHWVYLYYTGPQPGPEDLAVANQILESLTIAAKQ